MTLSATTTSGRSTLAIHNIKKSGQQWMLFTGLKMSRSVTYSYNWKPGVKLSNPCTTNCEGIATVTATANNPANSWYEVVTITNKNTGKALKTFRVAPGATGVATLKVADATLLDTTVCYAASATAACSTSSIKVGTTYEVVCPPWASASVTVSLGCASCSVTAISFTVPDSVRYYTGTITIGDAIIETDLVTNGTTNVPLEQLGYTSGDKVVVAVGFKVYRDEARTILLKEVMLGQVTITVA